MATRSRLLAGLFGFLVPGLGHLYIGRAIRFAPAVLFLFLVVAGLAAMGAFPTFFGMAFYVLTLFGVVAYSTIDSMVQAKPDASFERRWYNRWYVYLGWLLLVIVVLNVPRLIRESVLGFSAFRIPTAAMYRAIAPKDIILVDTRAYRSRSPDAKEVVVVHNPTNGLMYVRRVSKLDGSTLSLVSDSPGASAGDSLSSASVSDVLGKVTYIMYAHEFARIGRKVD
jgi:hypothetical protein